ncbi:hypothetical protein AZI86_04325 [Bdellovibrio bacteriovorus]|uniref:Uncharacterized protein n=1 Tax=Bdellovibrio bacteriovorus TaxID=959 RepID=A0A150WPR2_BDEBC|nr:hypothetical protein [Bdellovibrio bacteriovorus]KYG66289.1 hypothetical protein AZI86_04325 [Bdellovibrio bacteriovorus]
MATTTLGSPGQHRNRSMNMVYWGIAVVVVLGLVAYFMMRSPMTTPTGTQDTVNTEARSGEIGSSGATTTGDADTTVPARTNDTDQR